MPHRKALRPGPSGEDKAPNHANYDESKAKPFPDLPPFSSASLPFPPSGRGIKIGLKSLLDMSGRSAAW